MGLDCPVEDCPRCVDGECADSNVLACYMRSRAKGFPLPEYSEYEEDNGEQEDLVPA